MKTVYCLKIRVDESQPWGPASYFRKRKDRDEAEMMNRCLGLFRTHSYEEKKPREEIDDLCDE